MFLRHKWIVILSIVQQSQFWTNIRTSSNLGIYCDYPECTARASTSIQLRVTGTMKIYQIWYGAMSPVLSTLQWKPLKGNFTKKYSSLLKMRGPDSGTPTLHWKQFLEQFCNEWWGWCCYIFNYYSWHRWNSASPIFNRCSLVERSNSLQL